MRNATILLLDHAPALGGAERSLLLLLKHLDRACWDPHLACVGGPLAEQAAALGVPTYQVPMPRLRRSPRALLDWLHGACAIARLARRTGAALIHANTVRAACYGAPAARLARIPFVWHMRDFWLSESRPRQPWADRLGKRLLCAAASRVIANSHAVAAHLPCPRKVTVVHNGIEVARFDPALDPAPFRQQHAIPLDAPLAGTVGRLRPWKGQERFLRAMAQVREAVPDAWGLIVGGAIFGEPDDYRRRLRTVATDLGLEDRGIFTDQLDDVRPSLAAMDLFVHPGDPEPFGLVNLEAMAMGKAVVAFAHGALPEIVADGETGILVPPQDEQALADAIILLLRDRERSRRMGAAGRSRVERHFTVAQTARAIEAVVRHLLDRGDPNA
jgi:glycosyltransferase involved in cell wall biosynthesis